MNFHFDEYAVLKNTYKVAHGRTQLINNKLVDINLDDYDVVIELIGRGYAHTKYRVVKNGPGLSNEQLAVICDRGNLCFGYRCEGGVIYVYTD